MLNAVVLKNRDKWDPLFKKSTKNCFENPEILTVDALVTKLWLMEYKIEDRFHKKVEIFPNTSHFAQKNST